MDDAALHTHLAMQAACKYHRLDMETTVESICCYAETGTCRNASLWGQAESREIGKLAETLQLDLHSVDAVVPAEERLYTKLVTVVIETLKERYYDTELDPEGFHCGCWAYRPYLKAAIVAWIAGDVDRMSEEREKDRTGLERELRERWARDGAGGPEGL